MMSLLPTLCLGMLSGAAVGAAANALFCGGPNRAKVHRRSLSAALLCGLGYAAAAARFGMTVYCVRLWILFALLLAAALFDLDRMEIPDAIPIAAVGVFLAFLPLEGGMKYALVRGVIGAVAVGGGLLLLSVCADRLMGRETLGGGDIKLFAVLGLHLGVLLGAVTVALSCLLGLIWCAICGVGKGKAFPFAPSIAVAALVTAIVGNNLIAFLV